MPPFDPTRTIRLDHYLTQYCAISRPAQGRKVLQLFLPSRLMILDVIGNFLTDRRQLKQFVFDDGIICLLGLLPIHGRLVT